MMCPDASMEFQERTTEQAPPKHHTRAAKALPYTSAHSSGLFCHLVISDNNSQVVDRASASGWPMLAVESVRTCFLA